ncbi:MAG: DUF6766 family protein [Actinomycetota bacterium]
MRWVRDNSLSLAFLVLFLATLIAQSYAGHLDYNEELKEHDDPSISWGRFVASSKFGVAVMENWQSEFLQFFTFILATIWLLQRGSNESKKLGGAGLESDEAQRVGTHASPRSPSWAKRMGGLRYHLYANSLLVVMGAIFLATWFAESVTGWTEYNADQLDHQQAAVSWASYIGTPDFWEKSLQNWQSEFLAVGTMVIFTVYLRQRGSPESKPVGAPHEETGSSG